MRTGFMTVGSRIHISQSNVMWNLLLAPFSVNAVLYIGFRYEGRQLVCSAAQKGDAHTRPFGLHIAESDMWISLLHPLIVPPSELEIHNPRMLEFQTLTYLQFLQL